MSASLLIGKAGPMVHTGACVASILGQGGSKRYRLTWRWLRFFKNDRDRRDLVTCGSAAGIAASFRAPVGGVLFALEEMSSWYVKLCQVILFNSMDFLYEVHLLPYWLFGVFWSLYMFFKLSFSE